MLKRVERIYVLHFMGFFLSFCWRNSPQWPSASLFTRFLDHTQRRTTVRRSPPDECLARRRDHSTRQHTKPTTPTTPMPPMGFEPKLSAGERPKTYAPYLVATGTGLHGFNAVQNWYRNINKYFDVQNFLLGSLFSYNTEPLLRTPQVN
jgi:hypothetical protein